jgi:hypothetical protein
VLGWVPRLIHGSIHEKFDVFYIKGVVAVWAWYTARCAIGPVCAASNLSTAMAVGATVAGIAFVVTGRHRW